MRRIMASVQDLRDLRDFVEHTKELPPDTVVRAKLKLDLSAESIQDGGPVDALVVKVEE